MNYLTMVKTAAKSRSSSSAILLIGVLILFAFSPMIGAQRVAPERGKIAPSGVVGDPRCTAPGPAVATDTTGDQSPPGTSHHDIQSVSFAEPFAGPGVSQLVITLKVASLPNPLPINTQWKVYFQPPAGAIQWVAMLTDANSAVTYKYGTTANNLDTTVGDLDAGTYNANGAITLTVANSKVGAPTAGQTLTAITGQTYQLVGVVLLGLDSTNAPDGTYTLIGNAACSGASTPTPTPTPTPTATPTPTPTGTPDPGTCINAVTQVATDPSGDQGALNPAQSDIQAISVGEDYRYAGSPRFVFVEKVANLQSIPPNQIWRVRFTAGATTYFVGMFSDASSQVSYAYGTQSGSMVTTVGGIESGSYTTDGNITLIIDMSKVGSPAAGTSLTNVNGVTQMDVGGAVFTGEDSTSNGNYTVRAINAACTPGALPPTGGVATYIKGGITFSPTYTTRAPYIGQDVEPSVRVDKFGNTYTAPIRGVPGGTDLWYFDLRPQVNGAANPLYDPFMRNPLYRGQPDSISGSEDVAVGGDGGGDVDMAVGFVSEAIENVAVPPILAYSSLALANISSQRSTDRGASFLKNPLGNVTGGVPGDDRQWMEFFGSQYVYLIYRTLAPAIAQVQRSVDGGLTYGNTTTVGTIGQVGGVDVDQNDGTVYLSGGNGVVAVGIPAMPGPPGPTSIPPATYTIYNVAGSGKAHIFFTVKVAADGTAYACYSDGDNILIQFTQNKGANWSSPIRVSDGPETATSVFAWLETGPTPGTIGVVWYGTDKLTTGDDTANWHVFYALGTGVTGANPVFRQVEAGDHIIHGANISESGLVVGGMSPNRNLADYFQVAFDPTGAAVISFSDDHNDFSGHNYVTRQISGPGVNDGAAIPTPVEGANLPPPAYQPKPTAESVGGIPGSQVTDFRQDVRTGGNPQSGGTVILPNDDATDILTVLYATEGTPAAPILAVTMCVSDLTAIPPSTNWRMNFTANALNSVLSPTGEFTFGVSDRGDQFYVRATTDAAGAQTFVYGTTTRNFDGSLTYTDIGAADTGSFNQTQKTVTVKVAVNKLNSALAVGRPPLVIGSILTGLRATTFTTAAGSGNNRTDTARGGTQYPLSFPVQLTSAASLKTHGVGGTTFPIDLPPSPSLGIECRDGGPNGDFLVVFTFPNTLTSVTGATLTGTGRVASSSIGADAHTYVVNLTGVTNAQRVTINLHNVADSAGNFSSILSRQMGVLLADVNESGVVDSGDLTLVRQNNLQNATASNFRTDVNASGLIDSGDVTLVRRQNLTALP